MNIHKLVVESKILGKEIYQLDDISLSENFLTKESSVISEYNPFYIQCQIDARDLNTIHSMEDAGFRFVEFRLKKSLITHLFHTIGGNAYYPYVLRSIVSSEDYKNAELMVENSEADDRFSTDPVISDKMSKDRLKLYLQKSFESSNEFIFGLINRNTKELLAIKSVEIKNKSEVIFCQTATKEGLDEKKYTYMIDSLLISQYISEGYQLFYAITSGLNLMEIDLHLSDYKYNVDSAIVILRKIYQ